jgi:ATP-dependent DNA ligase
LQISEHLHGDSAEVFLHACQLGCEGIVSKRLGSRYNSGPHGQLDQGQEPRRASAPPCRRER